jgi:hypothetical protein
LTGSPTVFRADAIRGADVTISNTPTQDRAQHVEAIEAPRVDAAAFRQGWRVHTRLDRLLADDRITPGEWQSAVEYRDAWARILGAAGGDLGGARVSGGRDHHDRLLGQLGTLAQLRAVEARIGRLASALCVACIVEDRAWAWVALQCHRNPETVRDWTALAIRALAGAWAGRRGGGFPDRLTPGTPRRRVRAS